ncbi:AMP-binding protein [Kocuria sp. cx-116]|uniref:AMP-binding protein n=1 Tax=Kocuria sp. cx-116 TaxID=2771378 RepID=UPI0016843841|nr:AMP-binding protein [Kocuria sp. cx-116]MBD2763331.1 AMP-binding protein [Kocuria sp. cx-116]
MYANAQPLSPLRFIERSAEVFPRREAIVYGDQSWTYREFERDVRRFATALLPHLSSAAVSGDDAAGSGDAAGREYLGAEQLTRSLPTVAVIAPNLPAMLMAHYAVPAAGAVLVPLNPRLSTRELDYILEHSEARVVIADSSVLDTVVSAITGKVGITLVQLPDEQAGIEPVREHSYGEIPTFEQFIAVEPREAGRAASSGEPGVSYEVTDENSPITLNYTSGTTGRPKGVLYGHRGAYLNSLGEVFHNGFDGATRYLWTLPMFHCNGWCTTWAVTAAGGTHVCLRAVRPDAIWDAFDNQAITHLCGAPAVCSIIVDADEAHALDNPIRITTAGAPPAPSIIERLESAGFGIVHVYGLTEVFGPITICEPQKEWQELSPHERAQQMSRQGVGMVQAEAARIVDTEMNDVPADGETLGEVVLRGNNVMIGYYKDPQATEQAFFGGWFHTGDLGVMHPNGYIQLRDRAKDIIISGGENISSIEVEQALYSHPDVTDVAVIGVAHEKWGERPVAYVVRSAGSSVTGDELREHVRERLSGFKVPDTVTFSDELPRTATGKVRKNLLRG